MVRRGKAWHSQEEGQLHFLPTFPFPFLGVCDWGSPVQFVSPLLCQPHSTSLPGLLGTMLLLKQDWEMRTLAMST